MNLALKRTLICWGWLGWVVSGLAQAQTLPGQAAPWPVSDAATDQAVISQPGFSVPASSVYPAANAYAAAASYPPNNMPVAAQAYPTTGTTSRASVYTASNAVPGAAYPATAPAVAPMGGAPVPNGPGPFAAEPEVCPTTADDDCCAICGVSSRPSDWYMEQGVRVLYRGQPLSIQLGYDYDSLSSNYSAGLTSRTAAPNVSAAWATTIGHYFLRDTEYRDHFVEFSFWGLNEWEADAQANGSRIEATNSSGAKIAEYGSLFSAYIHVPDGIDLEGFNRADTQTTRYAFWTNNYELNGRFTASNRRPDRLVLRDGQWRHECQPGLRLSYLYGLRFLQLNETFRFHSEGVTDTYNPSTGALIDSTAYAGNYDVVAHNNLLGLQIGAELLFEHCRWNWGFRTKAGPYLNFSEQISDINAGTAAAPEYSEHLSAREQAAAFIGEVGCEASYRFTRHLRGRAAYDMMWAASVAFAPEQMQFDLYPVNTINTTGVAFFQGFSFGLEWLW